jgi:hypothetical protein
MRDLTEADGRTALAEAEDFVAMVEALIPQLLAEQAAEGAEGEASPEAKNDSAADTDNVR